MVRNTRVRLSSPCEKLLLGLFLCALITNISAGLSRGKGIFKCVSFCKESSKFEFEGTTTNIYEYTTQINTSVIGGTLQQSNLYLAARLEISSPAPCELQLQVTNVRIEESQGDHLRAPVSGADELIQQLQQNPLRYSFQNGKIEHICATEDEHVWVLNVKRGMLSILQNTMNNLHQEQTIHDVDVSGRCLTQYVPSGTSQSETYSLQRHKDLKGCTQHHSHLSVFQSIPYTSNSPTQTIPLLTGKQVCSQTIVGKKMKHVECREVHLFQPFENEANGAQTTVTQRMIFVAENKVPSATNFGSSRMRKTSLVLEMQKHSEAPDADVSSILALLETLDAQSFPKVTSETPEHFIDLVQQLRSVKYDELKTLLDKAPGKTGRQHILDALPLVGTATSLTFMRELFQKNELTGDQVETWLSSLNFIKNPNIDMISAVWPLLEDEPGNKVLLSVSSLVYSYCKEHEDCTGQNSVIEGVLQKLISFLGTNCKLGDAKREDLTGIVVALKAIGNTGRLPSNDNQKGLATLKKCFEDNSNPTEIRLAAVDAFRRIPCRFYKHDPIVELFTNAKENTEVRIHAYLISMKCPDRQLIKTIESILYTEPVNQVGSFIWTHMTNLQETFSPDKQAIKDLVSNNYLQEKFSTDARKYSRNYEGTMYWEKENVGVGVDSNIIFVPDSFVPRSAMVNLTCHLFGESVNLVEFGARIHSLEQLLEPLFGPTGYFPDQTVNEALHTLRVKRDLFSSEVRRLDTVYSQAAYGNEPLPGGSIYTRVFGNELNYKTFEISHKTPAPTLIDETGVNWLDFTHLFENLRTGKSSEFTKSSVLMDASYIVSTSAGIPLSLNVQSAATVTMSAKGRVDLGNFWDKNELEIEGLLRPSAAIQVHGTLSVQLGKLDSKIKSGLKLQTNMHSSTGSHVKVMMKGSKIVHFSLTLPEDKQEVFTTQSQLLIVHPSGTTEIIDPTQAENHQKICTPEILSRAFGIQLCGETNIPEKVAFPLFTPASLSIYIEKTDVFRSYEFDYKWEEDVGKADVGFVFSTPGSKINRRVAIDFHYDKALGNLETILECPGKYFRADGKFTSSQQGLELVLASADKQIFHFNTALVHSGTRIEPVVNVAYFGKQIFEVGGAVDLFQLFNVGGKANLELTLKHLTQTPIQLKGDLVHNADSYDSTLSVDSYLISGNSKSQFKVKPNLLSGKSEIKYSWKLATSQTITASAKVQKTRKGSLTTYSATSSYLNSNSPDNHVEFEWETQTSVGYCANTVTYILGKSRWEGKILYNQQSSREHHELHYQASLLSPKNEVDYNFEVLHTLNSTGMITKFDARTNPKNALSAQLRYFTETKPLSIKSFLGEIAWSAHKYSLRAFTKEIRPGEFESEILISPNRPEELKGTLLYRQISTSINFEERIEFRIRGFLTSVISGSVSLSASEKLRHIGGLLEIEGNKIYNGRWSGNVDYSVKKKTKKIEGKLSLNENKYNVELNSRQTKNGDRVLLFDLQMPEASRIRVEAQMKGALPKKVVSSLIVYPDRDTNPSSKIVLRSSVDLKTAEASLDYFGSVGKIGGSYRDKMLQVGASWTNNMLFNLTILAPHFERENVNLNVNLQTARQGLNNLGFRIRHRISQDNQMNTELQVQVDKKLSMLGIKGVLSKSLYLGTILLDISEHSKFEGNIKWADTRDASEFVLAAADGEKLTSFKMEKRRIVGGHKLLIDFSGCNGVQEFTLDMKHQRQAETSTNVLIEWTPINSNQPKQITLHFVAEKTPWNFKFIFTSPVKNIEKLDGIISWQGNKTTRALDIGFSWPYIAQQPVGITASTHKENTEFKHSLKLSWPSGNKMTTILAQTDGRISSDLKDIAINASLAIPNHVYGLILQRNRDMKHYTSQVAVLYDNNRIALGTNWHYENTYNNIKINSYISAEWPSQPKLDLHFHFDQNNQKTLLQTYVMQGDSTLAKFNGNFQFENWQYWDVTCFVDSQLEWFPTARIVSQNRLLELSQIHHITEVSVTPKFRKFADVDTHQISLTFDIKDGQDILGTIHLNKEEVKLSGKYESMINTHMIKLELTSPLFEPMSTTADYRLEKNDISISVTANVKERNVLNLRSGAKYDKNKISGNVDLSWPLFGHRLEANAEYDHHENSALVSIKEDGNYLISLVVSAQLLATRGHVNVDIQSKFNPELDNFKIDMKYKIVPGKFELDGKYSNKEIDVSLNGLGVFNDDTKKISFALDGPSKINGEVALLDWNRLNGHLSVGDKKQFELNVQHTLEKGEFTFGKHVVTIDVDVGKSYQIIGSLALGTDKIIMIINTPFNGWKEAKIETTFKLDQNEKLISIRASRGSEEYSVNLASLLAQQSGTFVMKIETPIEGIKSGEIEIKYSTARIAENLLRLSLEEQTVVMSATWTETNIELKVETPFQAWRSISLSGEYITRPNHHINFAIAHNDIKYQMEGNLKLLSGIFDAELTLSGAKKYSMGMSYDITKDYKGKAFFVSAGTRQEIGGFIIQKDQTIHVGIYSPFSGLEDISAKIEYSHSDNGENVIGLEWDLNGQIKRADFRIIVQSGKLQLIGKTPFQPWDDVILGLEYVVEPNRRLVNLKLERGDGKHFVISSDIQKVGGNFTEFLKPMTASLNFEIKSNLTGLDNFKLNGRYNRLYQNHELSASSNIFGEPLEGKMKIQMNQDRGFHIDLDGEASAPGFGIRVSSLKAFMHADVTRESTMKADLNINGKHQIVEGTFKLNRSEIDLHVQTSFHAWSLLRVKGIYAKDGRLDGAIQINEKRAEVKGQVLWGGLSHTKVVLDFTTPFERFKSAHITADSNYASKQGTASLLFQNDHVRYIAKADGSLKKTSGHLTLQINTPILKFERIVTNLQFNETGALFKLERNTKVELGGQFDLTADKILFNLLSNIPGYQIDSKSYLNWGMNALAGKIDFESGILGQQISVKTVVDGIRSVDIEIGTSIQHFEKLKFQWHLDGTVQAGNGRASYMIPKLGHKSVRAFWKNQDNKNLKAELWFNSTRFANEKGFSIQYGLASGKSGSSNFGGALIYVLENKVQELTLTTAVKRSGNKNTLEIVFRTPFKVVKEIVVSGTLFNNPEIALDIQVTHNKEKLMTTRANILVSPANSKLKITFNAPMVCDPFNFNAAYDLTTNIKTLEISFLQNEYEIKVKTLAVVPQNSQEIELRMTVDSNVPSVTVSASGSLKAGYKVEHDGNQQVLLSIDSEQTGNWKLTTSIRNNENFNLKISFDSPAPEIIPPAQVEIKSNGDFKEGVSTELTLKIRNDEMKTTLTTGPQKFLTTFTSNIPGVEDFSLEGKIDSSNGYKAKIEITAANQRLSLTGDVSLPSKSLSGSGSIALSSSWDKIPSGSLNLKLAEDGEVEMNGIWGDRNVGVRGQLKRKGHSSLLKSGDINLAFILDSQEQFRIASNHYFVKPQFSLNITIGDQSVTTYVRTDSTINVLSAILKWNKDSVAKFYGESKPGHFNATVNTPWTSELQITGDYVMSEDEHSAKGIMIYGGIQSLLEADLITEPNSFKSHVNVDIPMLNQKMEAIINIKRPNSHLVEGNVELNMIDRHLAIRGILFSENHKFLGIEAIEEKTLQLSILFPNSKYSDISTEVTFKKPVDGFASLTVDAKFTLPTGLSKGSFHYELPIQGSNVLAAELKIDSPTLVPEPVYASIKAEINSINSINATLKYGENDIRVAWDLGSKYHTNLYAYLPTVYPDSSPLTIGTEGQFDFPKQMSLHIRASCEKNSLTSETSFVQTYDGFNTRVSVLAPVLFDDKQEFYFKVNRVGPMKYISEFSGRNGKSTIILVGELVLTDKDVSLSGKASGVHGAHFIQVVGSRDGNSFLGEVSAESLTLLTGKKIIISSRVDVLDGGFAVNVECRTRKAIHSSAMKLAVMPTHGILSFKLNSPEHIPIKFDSEYNLEPHAFDGKVSVELAGEHHSIQGKFDMRNWEGQLTLECPILTHDPFNIHFKCAVEEKDVSLLGDLKFNGTHWRLEGTTRFAQTDDIEIKLELITPEEGLERITVGVKLDLDEVRFELQAPALNLPNFVFSLSGVPLFGEIDLTNMKPEIIIGLPWIAYSAALAVRVPDEENAGEFLIMFQQNQPLKKELKHFEFGIDISPLGHFNTDMDTPILIKFRALTPYPKFKKLEWELGGHAQLRNWAEIKLSANFNDKEISFQTELRNEIDSPKFSAELLTPFKNYERFTFTVQVQNFEEIGYGRSIQVEFYHPGWEKPVHLEADYNLRFNDLMNIEAELSLKAPGMEIPPLIIQFNSNLKGALFSTSIDGIWGEQHSSLKINGGFTSANIVKASVELKPISDEQGYQAGVEFGFNNEERERSLNCRLQLNFEEIFSFKLSLLHHSDKIEAEFALITPFTIISSASSVLRISSLVSRDSFTFTKILKSLDVNFEASLNGNKLFQFEVMNRNGRRSLTIYNPFQPISLAVIFDKQPMKLRLYSELCWNLQAPGNNSAGFGLTLDRSSGIQDVNLKLLAGEKGTLELIISHYLDSTKLDHNLKIKWKRPSKNQDLSVGFGLLLNDLSETGIEKYDVVVRVDNPWRCIEIESRVETGDKTFSRLVLLRWDALRNPYKRLGIKYARDVIPSWQSFSEKKALTLIHSALPHDLTFTLEKSFANDEIQFTEFTLQPNSFPHDKLTIRISHLDMKRQGVQFICILPSINLDVNLIARSHDTTSIVYISHMDLLGDRYAWNLEVTDDESVTLVDIQTGPENNLNTIFHLESRPQEDIQILNFKIAQIEFNANFEKRFPLLRANLNFDYPRKISLIAGLPHKKEIIFKITRNEQGMNINEVVAGLKLNTSQTLSSRLLWRPEIFNDLHKLSTRVPKSIKGYLTTAIPKALAHANDEVEERLRLLDPNINRLIETLKIYTLEEIDHVSNELGSFADYLVTLPMNTTYLNIDVSHYVQIALEELHELNAKSVELLESYTMAALNYLNHMLTQGKNIWTKYYGNLENAIMPLWDEAETAIAALWEQTIIRMAGVIDKVNSVYETLKNIIEGNLEALEKQINGISLIQKINHNIQEWLTWFEELPIQDYTGYIWDTFVQNVWHPLEHYSKPIYRAVGKIIEDRNLFALFDIPPLPYVKYVTLKTTGIVSGLWNLVEAEQKIKELSRHILHNFDNIMQRHIPTASVIWDLKNGQIEYHQPLNLLEWNDFTQMPTLLLSDDDEVDGRQITDFYFSLIDTLRSAQPFLDFKWRDILPPFGAHAIMAGDHHYYTFDKKYFRFSGDCSYVLVADLLHQNFTLIVNYENRDGQAKKKSYSLISGDKVIEIDIKTFKVTLQGRKMDLPLEVGPTFIRRQPTGLELFDKRGFQMRCTQAESVCIVSISGWYFGKVGGLLGTYDNEKSNEFKTPDGQISTDISHFSHSWRVGGNSDQCRAKNFAKNETPEIAGDDICGELLLDVNSPFRPCFGTVDPTAFMEMCKYDTIKNRNSAYRRESACTAIGAYVLECQKHKIDLWMPSDCVRCKLENGDSMRSGENVTLNVNGVMKPPNSSDIVVLLEEAVSLQEYNLNDIMTKLDLALVAEGLTNNRYAFVRFGGKGPHRTPHIRTVAGQVWVHSTLRKYSHDTGMEGQGGGDMFDAIEYAATIGHRAGVSKIMIAIIADNEQCGDSERYPDALTMLVENDFRLHILTPKDFALKYTKKNEDGKDIFGVDAEGVYTWRQSKRSSTESDTALRQHVVISKDFCTPLAIETNGTSFNLKHIHRSSSKRFIDVWSRRIARTSHPSECQNCECVPDKNGGALLLCNQCVSPHMKRFFDDWDDGKFDAQENYDESLPGDLPADDYDISP